MTHRTHYTAIWRPDRSDPSGGRAQSEARDTVMREVSEGTEAQLLEAADFARLEADLADAGGRYAGAIVCLGASIYVSLRSAP